MYDPYYKDVESIVKDIFGEKKDTNNGNKNSCWNQPLSTFQKEAIKLLSIHQYESVELLARFDNSQCELNNNNRSNNKIVNYWLLGESNFRQQKYKIAKEYFEEIQDHYKIAYCLYKTGSLIEAIHVLENAPSSHASNKRFECCMLLGKLYSATSRQSCSLEQYQIAHTMNEYGMEAILCAMSMGGDKKHFSNNNIILPEISTLLFCKYHHQLNLSLNHAINLDRQFPNNVYLKMLLAEIHSERDNGRESNRLYGEIRIMEPGYMTNMDKYAAILGLTNRLGELSELVDSLLSYDDKSPITWTALSVYHRYNNYNKTGAMKFIEKAIRLDERHAFAYFVQGHLLLQDNRPEHAAVSFFRSNEIEPSIPVYEGLVDAYLGSKKDKEAIAAAKEVYNLAPRDPRTLTLVGLALAQGNSTQAKRSLTKALQISPALSRPLFCLVDICLSEKQYEVCIDLLTRALEHTDSDAHCKAYPEHIHCKLGDVYEQIQNYKQAVEQYNLALVQNPECEAAMKSLENLDKLMRGGGSNNNHNNNGGMDSEDHEIVEDQQSVETPTY